MDIEWRNEKRKVSSLIPWDKNPRKISDEQMEHLKASISKFNYAAPIVVDADGRIVAGHMRCRALVLLGRGEEELDVRVASRKLSEEEFRELAVRDNANGGEFDPEKLLEFNPKDLLCFGMEKDFIDKVFIPEFLKEADEAPSPKKETSIKRGDIFELGDHRVMCGDSTDQADMFILMNHKKADMVFTDPPYGVSYGAKNEFLNAVSRGNRIQTPIENDQKNEEDIQEFWFRAFERIKEALSEVNSYYITGPQIQGMMMMMMMMMMKAGLPYRHVIIWVKNNHVLGRCDYNYKHEPIFFGWTKTHKFYGNGEFQTSVWEVDKPHKSDLHPTMKPIRLIANALQNSSERGQICLDPFLGSGSTLIACEETGRICYGMEIDPIYCQVVIDRWQKFTGKEARLLS